jgi:CRP-like cAMP-binding protein
VRFPAESTVIQQGEIGDCLYVIADGTVGIHINQQFIARLGSGEIVGEFALLDSEPRSASVITEEDCRLYRLDQRTFYDLMAERTEVARGIIQVLCRRLREQLAAVRQRTAAKAAKAHLAPAPALPPTSSIVARAPAVPSAPASSSQTTGGSSRLSVGHLLPIEKVIILKTVSFFEQTPFPILAEIVSILEEVEFVEGERIIEKGEIGNCMFIIISGAVRVHDEDEKTLAVLGDRSVFGELSVLDAEPRTAFVTAVEETRLFRLDQDAFYELMADRSEVAGGIIRVLTQRIRALMQQK